MVDSPTPAAGKPSPKSAKPSTSDDFDPLEERVEELEKRCRVLEHVAGVGGTREGVAVGVDVVAPKDDSDG